MNRVAIYARVSTGRQETENQLEVLREYTRGMDVYKEYVDVVSGMKDTRPKLDEMMQDARKREFTKLIIWKVDRLGRSTIHMLQVMEELSKMGVNVVITTLGIDTSSTIGKFVFGLLSQVAELEREFIVERTNTAMQRIKKNIEKKGYYITRDGKKITSLGRPKGKADKKPRKKKGYYLRDYKKHPTRLKK